ncbi:MAG: hypothetical protein KUG60_00370 [Gammaproteobacteria bacterium]|nr:hypothetical protein [Gammaproteobacteria bacterium]
MTNKLQKFIKKITAGTDKTTPIFDKTAIDNIKLIRQRLKEEFGDAPELQDPRLLEKLIEQAYHSKDAISRSHIRKLMDTVGEPWISHYNKSNQQRIAECKLLK